MLQLILLLLSVETERELKTLFSNQKVVILYTIDIYSYRE